MSDFVHLHTHSEFSLIDGLSPTTRLVSGAAALGFKALGLTDHGSLAGAISFTNICHEHGIKPVLGMEAYVGLDGHRFHLTLLADGNEGFKTLVELNNMGQRGDDTVRPTFSYDALRRYNKGLIVMTGCPASPFHALSYGEAKAMALELKGILDGRLFAEVQFISHSAPWERSLQLARDLKLIPIVTNDTHFLHKADSVAHKILTEMKAKFSYESELLFLATANQLRDRVMTMAPEQLELLEKGMKNSVKLASRLQVVKFNDTPKLPHIEDANEQLAAMASANLRATTLSPERRLAYEERVKYELDVITEMGFSSYFLILQDIISFAKSQGVRIGPGRGSGAGSLVLFLLGCTEIDPMVHGLSFDRFLNRMRREMPDVDTDIEAEQRDVVLDYAARRWGAMPVVTFSRYSHKSLTHDLARSFHVPRELDAKAADDGPGSDAFKKLLATDKQIAVTYEAIMGGSISDVASGKITSGQVRHKGQHAGGVVIADSSEPLPLERTSGGDIVVGWTEGEHRELTSAGLVKFDLLGLSALSILSRLEKMFGHRADPCVDGSPVFSLFQLGDLLGIFQFAGSQGIIEFTKKVKPKTFSDLVAINALYRPGALDSGAAKHFPEWRKKPRKLHPLIDDILDETYGIICYQEQFMAILDRITGGGMAAADLARRTLAKARPGQSEWEAKFAKLTAEFFEGAEAKGIDRSTAETIWGEIITHTRYSFNKSHSVAYAQVAWEMAWWKYNHPRHFYAALMTVDQNEWQRYLFNVISDGIQVEAPHVNISTTNFEVSDKSIKLPLTIVKNLGDVGVEAIISAAPFKSLQDFMERVPARAVNSRAREGLFMLGAFDGLPDIANAVKVLKLKEEPEPLTQVAAAIKYMGLFLPTGKIVEAINTARKQGLVSGMIFTKEKRSSAHGQYWVYKLLPDGAVWSREHELEVGQLVKMKVRAASGKIISVSKLSIS